MVKISKYTDKILDSFDMNIFAFLKAKVQGFLKYCLSWYIFIVKLSFNDSFKEFE
jgi:hypothetical protein